MPDVSHSKIKLWRRCHKAFEYKYIQRLEKKSKPAPLLKGIFIHDLLNARATGQSTEKVVEAYEAKYRKLILAEKEEYGDLIPDMLRVFEAYLRHFENEKLKYRGSEILITTDLTKTIRFIGYIDKMAEDEHDLLYVMDHKSSRSLPNEEQRFSDLQLLLYVWGWNQENTEKASGVIWDHIRTKPPGIPMVLKDGTLSEKAIETDYHTYLQTIKKHKLDPKDYEGILGRLKTQSNPFFERVRLPRPPDSMIKQVVEDTRQSAIELIKLGGTLTDRNMTKDCSWCQFYALCHAELRGQDAKYVKKSQYEYREQEHGDQEEAE